MALRKQLTILGIALGLLMLGLPISYTAWPARTPPPVALDSDALHHLGQLQSHTGVAADDWLGERWALVFFGFTHCADVCPATLSRIAAVLEELGDHTGQLQPIFITLDPERDTPELLASYITFFDKRILGLTGTPEQIDQLADAWGIYSRRVPINDSYLLDHSTSLFLLAPDGALAKRFSGEADSGSMADEIAQLLTQYQTRPPGSES